MVSIARRMSLYDRLRFLITVMSLGFAVLMITYCVGAFFGTIRDFVNLIDRTEADLWISQEGFENLFSPSLVPDKVLRRARTLDGVRQACGLRLLAGTLEIADNHPVQVVGIDPTCPLIRPWEVVSGDVSGLLRNDTIVMDDFVLRRDPARVGDTIQINDHEVRIVAIAHYNKAFFTSYAFVNHRTFAQIGGAPDHSSFVAIQLETGVDRVDVSRRLKRVKPEISVLEAEELRRSTAMALITQGMGAGIGSMAFVGILVSFMLSTLNIYTTTMGRLQEFAILKAIGATNWKVLGIIFELALIQTVVSSSCGLAGGLGLNYVLEEYVGMPGDFPLPAMVSVLVLMAVLSLLGALISVRKVMTVDPTVVFRA